MSEQHDHDQDPPAVHQHQCGNLFGCGDEQGTGVLREDIKDAAFTKRASDRLLHMDEMDQQTLDSYLSARGRTRRKLLRASSFMGALAAVGPWFSKLAHASGLPENSEVAEPSWAAKDQGRVHVVESSTQTVHLGVFDTTLAPVVKIDSGDSVSFPNTWSHFLNEMQPGVAVDRLADMRKSNPGRGPHSIIGPIYVNNAEPGDVIEVRYRRCQPFT
ncbi:MAG TPA: acetamidase, partial [Alphaproteobacteria bacterium]|nr:acetamidase [Alphaproteobacteria bacterium]